MFNLQMAPSQSKLNLFPFKNRSFLSGKGSQAMGRSMRVKLACRVTFDLTHLLSVVGTSRVSGGGRRGKSGRR